MFFNRRGFLKTTGLGCAGLGILAQVGTGSTTSIDKQQLPPFTYPQPETFAALKSQDGYHVLRLALRCKKQVSDEVLSHAVAIEGEGNINRQRHHLFHTIKDPHDSGSQDPDSSTALTQEERLLHVMVIWVEDADQDSRITVTVEGKTENMRLGDIQQALTMRAENDAWKLSANFLLDHEIGVVDPAAMGIKLEKESGMFSFVATADPQGGNPFVKDPPNTRMRIHNAFIEESVALVNRLKAKPAFTVVIGDVTDGWGTEPDFLQMNAYLQKIQTPLLYTIGNHETKLHLDFEPGYNMSPFDNFFAAQKAVNGLHHLLYSFNLGEWHFVFWPDPLRIGFWEHHPHYFEWLERDLEQHRDKPTMIFQHVPTHPIGIDPMISYCESPQVKRTFLDIAARHGNVRYILSGHVHIPIKASFKTAATYKGMRMINLPASGYRPRAFGEPDFCDGPCQGVAVVEVDGREARITYKAVTEDEYPYPGYLPAFDDRKHALWLTPKYELETSTGFVNGNFENGLHGWSQRWVYPEDDRPSNICEVRRNIRLGSYASLYLHSHKRGFETAGQDRLPQSINQATQAISLAPGQLPQIDFAYQIVGSESSMEDLCGAFVWLEGFNRRCKKLNIIYAVGWLWYNIGDAHSDQVSEKPILMKLDSTPDQWHAASLRPAHDFNSHREEHIPYAVLELDRLVVTLGTWTVNQGNDAPFSIYFDDFSLATAPGNQAGKVNDAELGPLSNEKVWWRGKLMPSANIAGEHRYNLVMEPRL